MLTEAQKTFYIEELKKAIPERKLFCYACKTLLGGDHITGLQLDVPDPKVSYRCPREGCPNHDRDGYRTLRNLGIPIYDTTVPTDVTTIKAPEPIATNVNPLADLVGGNNNDEDEVGDEVGDEQAPPGPNNDPRSEE